MLYLIYRTSENNKCTFFLQPTTKLACAVFNLPIPSSSVHSGEEKVDKASSSPEPKMLHKLLLVGHDQSGTSTIFKQVRLS